MAQLWRVGLTRRELATVLAALRFWQRSIQDGGLPAPEAEVATDGRLLKPMTVEAIDDLCQRLNTSRDHPIEDPANLTSAQDVDVIHRSLPYQRAIDAPRKGGK